MRKLMSYFVVAVCLLAGQPAFAQNGRIDTALDRYEQICDRCILLRDRSLRGEQIAPEELRSLLEQVSSLRATLQEGAVNMTQAQRQRFERIRSKYTAAFQPASGGSQTAVSREVLDLPTVGWKSPVVAEYPSVPTVEGEILRYAQNDTYAQNVTGSLNDTPTHDTQGITRVSLQKYEQPRVQVGVMALVGWRPEAMSYGAMVSCTAGRLGAYLKGRSNFVAGTADYSCLSNGTSSGGVIWTTGNERHSAWAVGGGAIICLAGSLSLYAGSGYGSLQILWEDSAGQWARVDDLSVSGISADAGLMLSAGLFTASAGVSTIKMKKPTIEVGVGVRF